MKFDRNTVLGFVILGALFIGYFYFTNKEQNKYRKQKQEQALKEKHIKDSIDLVNKPKQDSISHVNDSLLAKNKTGVFQDTIHKEDSAIIENDLIRVTFTTKGGQPKKVELKKFKGRDSNWVRMASTDFDKISYTINTGNQVTAQTSDLYFSKIDSSSTPDGSKRIAFTLGSSDSSGKSITHEYIIKKSDYMIDFNIKMSRADQLLTGGTMNFTWQYAAAQQESDLGYERQNTQIGYVKNGSFDYHTAQKRESKNFDESVKWVGIRQRFFFGAIVAKDNFTSGRMEWKAKNFPDSVNAVTQSVTSMKITVPASAQSNIPLSLYYGPSDYHILKTYGLRFEKIVNLGQGFYSFVRPINRFLIMPIFGLMKSLVGNYGIAILLLTLMIRLLISPLTYSSYLSGAKMKALRPELAVLKAKTGNDRQAMSMEQMKLFKEAGVNPLGGCIPALLQIPIFFALFSFFNSTVGLRGAEFLWSHDLSAYDTVFKFGTNIPLLGNHLSLFNVTACITSFLISWYSMSMTPDQSNPVMKYMPYIFPIFLLFFFNRLPSALTWYYTVSNLITLALQFIIQTYIIDHKKVLAKIEENRKKPKKQSKWQERVQQMQEQQKKMRENQQKNRR